MRLIDADALIFELEEWKKNPNNDDSAVDLVNHFIGIIRATRSAEQVTSKLESVDISTVADDKSTMSQPNSKLDLISRADAIDALYRSSVYSWSVEQDQSAHTWALNIIAKLPSADTVPFNVQVESTREVIDKFAEDRVKVVRCKDCKHYGMGNCYMYGGQMNEDDYCSRASAKMKRDE